MAQADGGALLLDDAELVGSRELGGHEPEGVGPDIDARHAHRELEFALHGSQQRGTDPLFAHDCSTPSNGRTATPPRRGRPAPS